MEKFYIDIVDLQNQVNIWKEEGLKIVFTNGCFDLLHLGHISYLKEARSLGDKLIVAINSDASVSKLKGSHRPINDEATRMGILSSFYFIDAVITFSEDTPIDLIKALLPDVLVKGGDWSIDQIVGSNEVIEAGGMVKSLKFIEGYSTTNIENKIIDEYIKRKENI